MSDHIRYDSRHAAAYPDKIRALIPAYDWLHQLSTELLLASLPPAARVLVAGSGGGEEVLRYAQAAPGWQLTGVEAAEAMHMLAQRRCAEAGLAARVHWQLGRLGEVALADGFDAATSLLVLHFLPDDGSKAAFLAGLARALRPGGILLLADLGGQPGEAGFEALFATWQQQQLRSRSTRPDQVARDFALLRSEVFPISAARRQALLAEAGLQEVGEYWRALGLGAVLAQKR